MLKVIKYTLCLVAIRTDDFVHHRELWLQLQRRMSHQLVKLSVLARFSTRQQQQITF